MNRDYLRKVGLSLANAAKRGDEPGVAKWATKALVALNLEPEVEPPPPPPFDPAGPPPSPDAQAPFTRSDITFDVWAHEWLAHNFENPFSLNPSLVSAKAKEQGVLAAITAAGYLGYPGGPWAEMGDFSWYNGYACEMTDDGRTISRVWVLGKLVAEAETPDAYGLALANGIEG